MSAWKRSSLAAAAFTLALASAASSAFAQAVNIDTRTVDGDGIAMRVQTAGWHHREAGRAIIVLENGAGAPVEAWQPVLATLAEFAPVMAYDRSGAGESPWDGEPPTPQHVNDRLRALLQQLGAEPPYVLVGFSWGGTLIQYFAAHWPDEVAGLVFIDASDLAWYREAERATMSELGVDANDRALFTQALQDGIARLPPGNQAEARVIEDLVTGDPPEFATLPQPEVPVARLVAGRFTPPPPGIEFPYDPHAAWHAVLRYGVRRFAESMPAGPDVTFIVATHAGHYMMGDDPDLVVEAIRRVHSQAARRGR
jgi:pimeloyl-ACP methyl ester carboxylesterase